MWVFIGRLKVCMSLVARTATGTDSRVGVLKSQRHVSQSHALTPVHLVSSAAPVRVCNHVGAHVAVQLDNWVPDQILTL